MGMTPTQFFEAFVVGNADDCRMNPGCVRRAFNASVAAFHLADHYQEYYRLNKPELVSQYKSKGDYVEYVCLQTNGAFRDIQSIANAYKHLYTDTDPKKARYTTVSSPAAIESIEINERGLDITAISHEYTTETNFRSFVSFTRTDGSKSEFLPILDVVVRFWYYELNKV
ncbi:MAG: hypothetical protein HPY65_18155 [Syntrophaceae bacterium]|nr:hypothetical protein [Syntrophaceae bacterium]